MRATSFHEATAGSNQKYNIESMRFTFLPEIRLLAIAAH
jgi:hypothetical protein